MVAAKFHDDNYCVNYSFAQVGGIPNKELNRLEETFLFLLRFDLFIDYSRSYNTYYEEIFNHSICCGNCYDSGCSLLPIVELEGSYHYDISSITSNCS